MGLNNLVKVELFKKDDKVNININKVSETFITMAKVNDPSVVSVNWYSANFGQKLKATLTIHCNFYDIEVYDRVKYTVDGHELIYNIFTKARKNKYTTVMEVGV